MSSTNQIDQIKPIKRHHMKHHTKAARSYPKAHVLVLRLQCSVIVNAPCSKWQRTGGRFMITLAPPCPVCVSFRAASASCAVSGRWLRCGCCCCRGASWLGLRKWPLPPRTCGHRQHDQWNTSAERDSIES